MTRLQACACAVLGVLAAAAAPAAVSGMNLVAGPMVEISKSCPALRYVGREASFELTVTNRGDAPAFDVTVTDTIPDGLDFRSADNGGARQGNNIVWRVGTLEPGQSKTMAANFACNRIGKFKNGARVSYCAEARDECEIEVKGIPAILLECVDDPDPIEVGSNLTYTITVTNQGSATDTNIRLTCTLPAEEEFVTSDGPTKGAVSGKTVTFEPLPSLAPKAKATYRLTVKGTADKNVRFKVEMQSDQIDSPVMETESTTIYE